MKKNKKKIRLMLLAVLLIFIIPGLDQRLYLRKYEMDSDKIQTPVRIVLLTDLHSCYYGKNQERLLQAIASQNPDMITLAGDIFDDQLPDENTETVLKAVSEKYPCCYVTGNHEGWCTKEKFQKNMQFLKDHHIMILAGKSEILEIQKQKLIISGIDDPDSLAYSENKNNTEQQMQGLNPDSQEQTYHILLSHRPELFPEYQNLNFDLVLCGHAHGGQWRIPYLLNGLYAPNQGLFPEYAGGLYQSGQMTMIVSRGLARESTKLPRFYNRPELVVIDLK
ncbi:MAG: metallophosphoesterase [Oscillospiraceae bacterium]|nr:metallophosphoesterase [Oscillospiraceae bacterium]